jgi:hypothetical protein
VDSNCRRFWRFSISTAGVPVTVNGDLKSNALKAIDGGSIISQCGTTITLGASGDTINLAVVQVRQVLVEQVQWIGIRLQNSFVYSG